MGIALGALGLALLVGLSLWAASQGDDGAEGPAEVEVLVADAASPAAVVPTPDGGLLFAERLTGAVRAVDTDGRLVAEPVALVDVGDAPEGQRGLLGLAIDPADPARVFAAWTRGADGRLVVGQVAPGPQRLVWVGPESSELANGGRLLWSDGRLVVGVGDLQDGERAADPTTPGGKVLSLDPEGSPEQPFEVLSGGWNNPFALALDDEGRIWVADNAGRGGFERVGRGDDDGATRTDLRPADEPIAPAGLAHLGGDRFGLCGYVTRSLHEVSIAADGTAALGDVLAPCAIDVAVLADGRVVVADEVSLSVLADG